MMIGVDKRGIELIAAQIVEVVHNAPDTGTARKAIAELVAGIVIATLRIADDAMAEAAEMLNSEGEVIQ